MSIIPFQKNRVLQINLPETKSLGLFFSLKILTFSIKKYKILIDNLIFAIYNCRPIKRENR